MGPRLYWFIHLRAQWLTERRWAPHLHCSKEYGTLTLPYLTFLSDALRLPRYDFDRTTPTSSCSTARCGASVTQFRHLSSREAGVSDWCDDVVLASVVPLFSESSRYIDQYVGTGVQWYFSFSCMISLPTGVAKRSEVDVFSGVCLFVCLFVCAHDNFRTTKHRTIKFWG